MVETFTSSRKRLTYGFFYRDRKIFPPKKRKLDCPSDNFGSFVAKRLTV